MVNLLVDTNSLAVRAYYVYVKAGHAFTFVNMLMDITSEIDIDNIYFMFDSVKNFRKEKYIQYKAGRKSNPARNIFVNNVRKALVEGGFATFAVAGYEADDLVASGCNQGDYVLTGDKDLLVLAEKATVIMIPGSFKDRVYFDAETVYKKYGVYPHQWVDFRAFIGDPSDGLPGIKGIGQKGAKKLLVKYHTLAGVYACLADLTPRTRRLLISGREYAEITKKLSLLNSDIPLKLLLGQETRIQKLVPYLQKNLGITPNVY